jgi:hypothetical protein
MKKNMALLIMALVLCCAFSGMVVANEDSRMVAAAAEEEKVVKISDKDWGYPTPFAQSKSPIRTGAIQRLLRTILEDRVISE